MFGETQRRKGLRHERRYMWRRQWAFGAILEKAATNRSKCKSQMQSLLEDNFGFIIKNLLIVMALPERNAA